MSNFSVAGLSSGLDTTSLVAALMQVERQSVTRLEASETRANDQIKAWDLITKRLEEAKTAVQAIRTGSALTSATATSNDTTKLRATSRAGALPGTYRFTVESLAAAQQITSGALTSGTALTGAGTARVSVGMDQRGLSIVSDTFADGTYTLELESRTGSDLTVKVNGTSQTVSIGAGGTFTLSDGSGGELVLDGGTGFGGGDDIDMGTIRYTRFTADGTTTVNNLVSALNATGGGVRAQVVDTGEDGSTPYRLVLSARGTGLDNEADIDLGGLSAFTGGFTTIREASNAVLSLGDGTLTISRSSNTITNAIPGITLDLVGADPDAEVEVVVSENQDAQIAAVRSVVDTMNRVLSQVRAATAYNVDAETGAPLVGSSAARSVSDQVIAAMGSVASGGSLVLLGQIGISLSRDGSYTFDETKLRTALANDPDAVHQMMVGSATVDDDGVLDKVFEALELLTDPDGRISTARGGAESTIRGLKESIAMQEARLEVTEQRYLRQFTAMETAIAQLQSQSSYLTSALSAVNG